MDNSETEEEGCPPGSSTLQQSHSHITFQQQSQPQHQHFQPHQQSRYFTDHDHSTYQGAHQREDATSAAASEALPSSAASSSNPDASTPPASACDEKDEDKHRGEGGTPTQDSTTTSTGATSPLTSSTGDNVSPPPATAGGMVPAGPLSAHEHHDHHRLHGQVSSDLTHQMIITSTKAPLLPAGPTVSQTVPTTQLADTSSTRDNTQSKATAEDSHSSMSSPATNVPAPISSTATNPSVVVPPHGPSMASTSGSSAIAIKILVSNNASGSIIGRSGQTISDLQLQSGSRIKLSQSGDCFPGTTDRVCLVQGGVDNVKAAVNLILWKLYDLQTAQHQQQAQSQQTYGESQRPHLDQEGEVVPHATVDSPEDQDQVATSSTTTNEFEGGEPGSVPSGMTSMGNRAATASFSSRGTNTSTSTLPFSVRILVPTPCCGMLIGRGGTNIKSMAESSGVSSIRLSPKETTEIGVSAGGNISSMTSTGPPSAAAAAVSATSERIVTVSGPDLNSCIICIKLILDGMAAHPEMCRYMNMTTSYTRAVSAAHAAVAAAAAAQVGTGMVSTTAVSIPSQSSVATATSTSPHYHQQPPLPSPSQSQQRQLQGGILSQTPHLSLVLPSSMLPSSSVSSLSQQPSVQTAIPSSQSHQVRQQQQQQEPQKMGIVSQLGATHGTSTSPVTGPMCPPFTHGHLSSSAHSQQSIHPPQQSMYVVTPPQASQSPAIPPVAYTQQHTVAAKSSWQLHGGSTTGQRSSDSSSSGAVPASTMAPSSVEQLSSQLQGTSPFGDTHRTTKENSATDQPQRSQQTPPTQGQQQASIQIAVPDNLIGAILGRGGQTLTELQLSSHTRIQISQRGVFIPGTNHRIVTITGPTADNVATAQYLINQRMARNTNRPSSTGGTSRSSGINRGRLGVPDSQDSSEGGNRAQEQQQQHMQTQALPSQTQQNYFLQQDTGTHHNTLASSSPGPQQHRHHAASSTRPPHRRHQGRQHQQRARSGGSSTTSTPPTFRDESCGSGNDASSNRRGNGHGTSQQQ